MAERRRAEALPREVGIDLPDTLRARLLRRYKRFFADVETPEGCTLTVHCPNPGSMRGCSEPGSAVRCSRSDDPKRKLRHTLEMIRIGRAWVGLHTGRANRVAARALDAELLPELAGYARLESEVRTDTHLGRDSRSRLDFRLSGGRRHLETLMELRRRGDRAALLFLVQRADCDRVAPADAIDPAYGEALRAAARAGVAILALGARVTARGIRVERRLPVLL